jgi:membrane-associated phospholipid phosphatase
VIWAILISGALGLLAFIAARSSAPLVDASLASFDRRLGLSAAGVAIWVGRFPVLRLCVIQAYELLSPLAYAALILPVLCGRTEETRRFLMQVLIAGLISGALFARWPAIGPWVDGSFPASGDQPAVGACVKLLKSGQSVNFLEMPRGIIAFPSFHVILALLSAAALWRLKYVRWIAMMLAGGVCVSTVATGWHYFTDVFGGICVAAVAALLGSFVLRGMENAAPQVARDQRTNTCATASE